MARIRKLIPDNSVRRDARTLSGENGKVWTMYVTEHRTQREIADELGISQPRVSQILSAVRESLDPIEREDFRREHLAELREMRKEADLLLGYDRIKARLKIQEREAHLLALDYPVTARLSLGLEEQTRYVIEMDDDVRKALQ